MILKRLHILFFLPLILACSERKVIEARAPGQLPDSVTMANLYEEVKTPHKYGIVLREEGNNVDCPSVFRYEDRWYMTYIIFGGTGYETAIAVSDDLLNWEKLGNILSFS